METWMDEKKSNVSKAPRVLFPKKECTCVRLKYKCCSHEHKMCHNPSLGLITKAKGKCYIKWIEDKVETWNQLAWVKRIPPRGGKSLGIKGKHP